MLGFNVIGAFIYTAVSAEERKELKEFIDDNLIDEIDKLITTNVFKIFNTSRYVWYVK
jgi:hypothetical protein